MSSPLSTGSANAPPHDELAAFARVRRKAQMFGPKSGAAFDVIVDNAVDQCEIRHVISRTSESEKRTKLSLCTVFPPFPQNELKSTELS